MPDLKLLVILLVGSVLAACAPENGEKPNPQATNPQVTEVSKYDQAFGAYVECTLVKLTDIKADGLESGLEFNKDAAIDQAIRNCEDTGLIAASILITEEAKDIAYKYRIRSSNVRGYALPIVERNARTLLDSILNGRLES